jgi:hypothetical protein
MTTHLDVLKNEWTSGVQRRIARITATESGVELTDAVDSDWADRLVQPLVDPENGHWVYYEKEPEHFLFVLADRLSSGSYLVAVGPHDDAQCPIPSDVVPMRSVAGELPS